MITEVKHDIFTISAIILVNPVNCVGVMGAGLAKQFKLRYPKMFSEYQRMCAEKFIRPGNPAFVVDNSPQKIPGTYGIRIICLFPTKDHWKDKSEYSYINDGLVKLKEHISKCSKDIAIAIPPLGCGLGGLDRKEVNKIIREKLGDLPNPIYLVDK